MLAQAVRRAPSAGSKYYQCYSCRRWVDVRWAALAGRKNVGVLAVGMPRLSVNALPYTTDDLQIAKHSYQLSHRDFVTLNLDLRQMGVGGDDSWGAQPHEEFRIKPEAYQYELRLRAYEVGKDDPATLAKAAFERLASMPR